MKICKFCFIFLLVFVNGYVFGYKQEGFLEYYEGDDGISFKCGEMCTINLGERGKANYLVVDGNIYGSGLVSIFSEELGENDFLYANRLFYALNSGINFHKNKINLRKTPEHSNLLVNFSGNIEGNLNFSKIGLFLKAWKDFWVMETFNYGGMNFRYGVFIGGHSIIEYGYITFILVVICILIVSLILRLDKRKVFKSIFYVGVCLFLLVGFRNVITGTVLLKKGLSGFRTNYNLFELRDYIGFVVKVRDKLNLDNFEKNNCKIFIKNDSSSYNRAVSFHGEYFFEPCERVYSGYLADYIAYSGIEFDAEDSDKEILVEYNGKYLLDNRMK